MSSMSPQIYMIHCGYTSFKSLYVSDTPHANMLTPAGSCDSQKLLRPQSNPTCWKGASWCSLMPSREDASLHLPEHCWIWSAVLNHSLNHRCKIRQRQSVFIFILTKQLISCWHLSSKCVDPESRTSHSRGVCVCVYSIEWGMLSLTQLSLLRVGARAGVWNSCGTHFSFWPRHNKSLETRLHQQYRVRVTEHF